MMRVSAIGLISVLITLGCDGPRKEATEQVSQSNLGTTENFPAEVTAGSAIPALLPIGQSQLPSAEERLEQWMQVNDAVAVFNATSSQAALALDKFGNDTIQTSFLMQILRVLKGTPPTTASLPGGVVGNRQLLAPHSPKIKTGELYLGFFRLPMSSSPTGPAGPMTLTLLFPIETTTDGEQILISGESFPLSSLIRSAVDGQL